MDVINISSGVGLNPGEGYRKEGHQLQGSTTKKELVHSISGAELTREELREIEELKETDRKVKQHEQAHKLSAGSVATSSIHYKYKIGPDGKRYAVEGNVQIDTSEVSGDPEETIQKARSIKRAALAPIDPSPKDRQVAAKAAQMETKARLELAKKQIEKGEEETNNGDKKRQETKIDEYLENIERLSIEHSILNVKV